MKHNRSGYVAGCRCDDCREANSQYQWLADRARERRLAAGVVVEHGNYSTYTNWRCRCPECTKTNSDVCKAYAARRRAATADPSP